MPETELHGPRWLSRVDSRQVLDGELELRSPLYLLARDGRIWRVEPGSRTDGSSIPGLARGVMPRWDLVLGAGAVHDAAYRTGRLQVSTDGDQSFAWLEVSREQADDLWRQGAWAEQEMRWREYPPASVWEWVKRRVDRTRRSAQIAAGHRALRLFGRRAWQGSPELA